MRARVKLLLLSGAVLAVALPALARNPESLLPPGFNDPRTLPPPATPRAPTPTPRAPQPSATPRAPNATPAPPAGGVDIPDDLSGGAAPVNDADESGAVEETTDSAAADLQAVPTAPQPGVYNLPADMVRSAGIIGVIGVGQRGFPYDAFGNANGAFLTALMERTDAPLPSRWASILLRRVLMSRLNSPRAVHPADFAAARTGLLTRMGEADAARMVAQSIDVENYSPKMIRAAFEASLAASDPAGLCPLVGPARMMSADPVSGVNFGDDSRFPMADAMCAAMEGEQARATSLLDQARRQGADENDRSFAEKLINSGGETRRAVTIQWDRVSDLNTWRFGLAAASGATIPDNLLNVAGPRMQAWLARAPMVPVAQRLAAAEVAAAMGVFSATTMVDLQALALDGSEEANPGETTGGRLQTAFSGSNVGDRLGALRRLWEADDPVHRYGRLVLTALASARVEPTDASGSDADTIIAALLSAGLDGHAARWASVAEAETSGQGWALLAVGGPQGAVGVDGDRVDAYASADSSEGKLRSQFLAAGLAGLGRVDPSVAQALGVEVGRENGWTQALDRAAANGQPGTVALLVAVGMQAPSWRDVPPDHLFRMVRALRAVRLDFEARMIAAEAISRT